MPMRRRFGFNWLGEVDVIQLENGIEIRIFLLAHIQLLKSFADNIPRVRGDREDFPHSTDKIIEIKNISWVRRNILAILWPITLNRIPRKFVKWIEYLHDSFDVCTGNKRFESVRHASALV